MASPYRRRPGLLSRTAALPRDEGRQREAGDGLVRLRRDVWGRLLHSAFLSCQSERFDLQNPNSVDILWIQYRFDISIMRLAARFLMVPVAPRVTYIRAPLRNRVQCLATGRIRGRLFGGGLGHPDLRHGISTGAALGVSHPQRRLGVFVL